MLPDGTPQYIYLVDLPPEFDPYAELYTIDDMAEQLCGNYSLRAGMNKIIGLTRGLSIGGERVDGCDAMIYSSLSLEIIRSELQWQECYNSTNNRLSAYAAAKILGQGHTDLFVNKTAQLLGIKKSKIDKRYDKSLLERIRAYERQFKQHEGWLSSAALTKMAGYRNPAWAEKRLKFLGYGYEPEQRWSRRGRLSNLYPPEAIELLREGERNRTRGGEMMTAYMISMIILEKTGLNFAWVGNRLKQYSDISELRDDDEGRTRTHYPHSVLTNLIEQAMEVLAETDKNDDLWSSQQACEFYDYDGERLDKVRKFLAKYVTSRGLKRYPRLGDDHLIITPSYDPDEIKQLKPIFIEYIAKTIKHKQAHGNFDAYDYEYLRKAGVPLDMVKADFYQPLVELVGYEPK